ncbi:hypothetical protein AVEN_4709-1 [Araneus ventricosus]|uniref:Uncharacterized protein n=1 Tax=Araneus ventricosus TaxID=182803 RepID=A0A4Y2TFF9_ARAVE|nr:hypothetical protein AVEN_4709-1 [Araneus ventricosus]
MLLPIYDNFLKISTPSVHIRKVSLSSFFLISEAGTMEISADIIRYPSEEDQSNQPTTDLSGNFPFPQPSSLEAVTLEMNADITRYPSKQDRNNQPTAGVNGNFF